MPVLLAGDAGEALLINGSPFRIRVDSSWTGGGYSVAEQLVNAHEASPGHVHRHEDQIAYVIEGEIVHRVGDHVIAVRAGEAILRPRNVPHALWNRTDAVARMLEVTVPGGLVGFFRECAALMARQDFSPKMAADAASRWDIAQLPEWSEAIRREAAGGGGEPDLPAPNRPAPPLVSNGIAVGGALARGLVRAEQAPGMVDVTEWRIESAQRMRSNECGTNVWLAVMEGSIAVNAGDVNRTVPTGFSLFIPGVAAHELIASAQARFLSISQRLGDSPSSYTVADGRRSPRQ